MIEAVHIKSATIEASVVSNSSLIEAIHIKESIIEAILEVTQ